VAMSDSDRNEMKKLSANLKIDVVPNGIDIAYFSSKKRIQSGVPRVLYVGNFKWLQNVEAVQILVNDVWPKIKAKIPQIKLWIVGMNITDAVREMVSEDIEISEGIPDIRDAYRKASVLVAPIKGPGGTRLKILEAMASALPVVTTSVGAEGLGVTSGREVLISDNLEEIADLSIKVIKDRNLSRNLGKFGRKFVSQKYIWEISASLLDDIYKEVVYEK